MSVSARGGSRGTEVRRIDSKYVSCIINTKAGRSKVRAGWKNIID
jgi:hypothetical protein